MQRAMEREMEELKQQQHMKKQMLMSKSVMGIGSVRRCHTPLCSQREESFERA